MSHKAMAYWWRAEIGFSGGENFFKFSADFDFLEN